MLVDERRNNILQAVEEKGFVSLHELAELVHASESTIRRDLEYLDSSQQIRRTRGGAAYVGDSMISFEDRASSASLEKQRIAEVAASLIEPGEAILLDGGTTTLEVARHLVARMAVPGVLPEKLAARLAHVMPISPVADLRPLLKTSMNAQFGMDEAAAAAESPVLQRPIEGLPVTVWVGADERPAFLDQAQWLADAWGCGHVVDPGKHHFDVIDGLADGDSRMIATLLS